MVYRAQVQTVEASVAVAALFRSTVVATLPGCEIATPLSASVAYPRGELITVTSGVLSSPSGVGLFPKLDDDFANRTKLFLQVRDIVLRVSELLYELGESIRQSIAAYPVCCVRRS